MSLSVVSVRSPDCWMDVKSRPPYAQSVPLPLCAVSAMAMGDKHNAMSATKVDNITGQRAMAKGAVSG